MTLLVRDEEDVLGANLDFHLEQGVDQVILMDNCSVDGTRDIARLYQRSGHLRYLAQPEDNYSQGVWVTRMARLAASEFGADWVINNDADEFWWPEGGRSLRDIFTDIPATTSVISAERTNFVPNREPTGPFWLAMVTRFASSQNTLGEPLPAKVAHRGRADVVVEQGNHAVRFPDEALGAPTPAPISILHFPVRTKDQFRNKIANGGAAYARNTQLSPRVGGTWRHLYALLLRGDFDQAYEQLCLSSLQIDRGLASGALIRDERLATALSALALST